MIKKLITPTSLFLILFLLVLQSCQNKAKQTIEIENDSKSELIESNAIPNEFKSLIRPNEKIKLGKTYTDTVKYINFNTETDEWFLLVEKNKNTIALIYNNESMPKFVKGDEIAINWKMDSIRYAGDDEFLDFTAFLVSVKKIKSFALTDKKVKVLWRENQYNEALETEVNTIILNENYIKNISEPEKAALAYVATFIGNECEWDGNVNDDRSNLKCKILTSLNLGYQCSDTHKFFLRIWFKRDAKSLKNLEICRGRHSGATIQTTFDEISIITNAQDQTILINYKVKGFNMREGTVWNYTKIDKFQYNAGTIILIDSEKIENDNSSNSIDKKNNSFVISCGSGCAMTYSENKVVANAESYKVTFKVEMFVSEVLKEEYYETYIFNCETSNEEQQITLQDNPDFNIENQHPDIQEKLTIFANELCEKTVK